MSKHHPYWNGLISTTVALLACGSECPAQLANGTHLYSSANTTVTLGSGLDVVTSVKNTGQVITWTRWQLGFLHPSWAAPWAGSGRYYMINGTVRLGETNYAIRTLSAADLPSSPGTYSFDVRAYYEASANTFNFMSNTAKVVEFTVLAPNDPPRFSGIWAVGNSISLTITNLLPGSTNDILLSSSLDNPVWSTGKTFIAASTQTNWSYSPTQAKTFYKIRSRR